MSTHAAPEITVGQAVKFEGRPAVVTAYEPRGGIVTLTSYTGTHMVGRTHPELEVAA